MSEMRCLKISKQLYDLLMDALYRWVAGLQGRADKVGGEAEGCWQQRKSNAGAARMISGVMRRGISGSKDVDGVAWGGKGHKAIRPWHCDVSQYGIQTRSAHALVRLWPACSRVTWRPCRLQRLDVS